MRSLRRSSQCVTCCRCPLSSQIRIASDPNTSIPSSSNNSVSSVPSDCIQLNCYWYENWLLAFWFTSNVSFRRLTLWKLVKRFMDAVVVTFLRAQNPTETSSRDHPRSTIVAYSSSSCNSSCLAISSFNSCTSRSFLSSAVVQRQVHSNTF